MILCTRIGGTRLDGLMTGDGRPLPSRLKGTLVRELARIELLLQQIADVETERDVSIETDRSWTVIRIWRPCSWTKFRRSEASNIPKVLISPQYHQA